MSTEVGVYELDRRMAGLEQAVAVMASKLDTLLDDVKPRSLDVEQRLRALERARWTTAGAAMGLGAIAGYLAPLLHR